ncbi:hypothetical protein [Acidocella sp.]|uniref:hypothetical protein n=1 Tax=Acidocella sp. TaxID=50710 RepID=UPI002F4024FB
MPIPNNDPYTYGCVIITLSIYTDGGVLQARTAQGEEIGRFLKKAAQKPLLIRAMGVVADDAHGPD